MRCRRKNIMLILVVFLHPVIINNACFSEENYVSQKQLIIDGRYEGVPLVNVIKNSRIGTDYQIVVPDDLLTMKIYGNFKSVSLDIFFRRILKENNYSLIIDDEKKTITVEDFGIKSKAIAQSTTPFEGKNIDPLSGIPLKELKELKTWQLENLKIREGFSSYIDPSSGLRKDYLENLHIEQLNEQRVARQRGLALDPESGISLHELEQLHSKQLSDQIKEGSSSYIDPSSGLRKDYLENLHIEQLNEQRVARQRGLALDPESGISLDELERLHFKQLSDQKTL